MKQALNIPLKLIPKISLSEYTEYDVGVCLQPERAKLLLQWMNLGGPVIVHGMVIPSDMHYSLRKKLGTLLNEDVE